MKNKARVKFGLLFFFMLFGAFSFSPTLWADELEQVEVLVSTAAGPSQGVKVYLFSGSGAYQGLYEQTDTDGKVSFELTVGQSYKFRADILSNQYWSDIHQVAGGGTNSVSVNAGGGSFTITVQEDSQTPMQGITVYLFSEAGAYLSKNAITDASGNVVFDVPEGSYKVRADYMSYQFWSSVALVDTDIGLDLNITHQDVIITVNGVFTAAEPLEGITVYLFAEAGTYMNQNLQTDINGQVVFHVPDRAYKVRADYLFQQYWSEAFTQEDKTIAIPMADAEVTVGWSSATLPDVPVYAFTASGSYLNMSGTSDSQGKVTFRLPAGSYKFRADYQTSQFWSADTELVAYQINPVDISTGGGSFVFTVLKNATDPLVGLNCHVFNEAGVYFGVYGPSSSDGTVTFDLAAGNYSIRVDYLGYQFWSSLYNIPSTLSETFVIPHQPVDVTVNGVFQGSTPLEGLSVYLFTSGGNYQSISQVTDANGQVTFDLPNEEYKVRVDYLTQQYWSDPFTGTDVTVGIPMTDAEITVSGSGLPLESVPVYVFTETGTYLNITDTTGADGKVTFRLPAGTYKFRADYQNNQYWSDVKVLIAEQVNPVDITTGGGTFVLTVMKDSTDPLVGVACYVFNEAGTYLNMSENTSSEGQVSFNLSDGSYKFRVDYLGYQFWSNTYVVPDSLFNILTIDHQDVIITVNGMYQGVSDPLEGISVYLFTPSSTYMNQNQVTDINGQVTFSLPEHPYKVRADYMSQQFWSDAFTWQDTTVEVQQGLVQVHVVESGADVEGSNVYLFTEGGAYLGLNETTNASGVVEFLVAEGNYLFRADEGGVQRWSEVTTVNGDQQTTIEIELADPPPTVTLSADPMAIVAGGSSILTWSSTDADTVTIDQGIGSVDLNGSTTVSPTETTLYTITAEGPGGTVADSVEIQVGSVPADVDYGLSHDEQEGGGGLVGETIRILNGNAVEYRSDLNFSSPNSLGLTFPASYNSKSQTLGSLGFGWTHTYDVSLDPSFLVGSITYLKIIDQTGRASYFAEDTPGEYQGAFFERSLVKEEGGEYVWYRLNGSRFGFSLAGKLIWIEDEKQNRLTVVYDVQDRPETVTDTASGRTLTFNYNVSDRLETITGPITPAVPTGIWVTYGYDTNNNLSSVTYADNSGYTYGYTDPEDINNLTEKRDKENHLLNTWSYDSQDRCENYFSTQGRGVSISYVSASQVDVTDAYGTLRTYALGYTGDRKRVVSIQGPGWSPYGVVNSIRWAYDSQMRLIEVEYANGTINQYQNHDARGNPGTVILAVGTPEQRTIMFTYHPDMNAPLTRTETSVLGTGNKVTVWDYDDDGNTVSNENSTKRLYRVVEQGNTKNAGGVISLYEYITTVTYNAKGQIASIDGPRAGTADTTSYTYDPTTGNLLSFVRSHVGSTLFSAYDTAGFVGTITDVNNQSKTFAYDGRGRVTSVINNSDSSFSSTTYTLAGQPWVKTDADGVTRTSTYESTYGRLDRLTDQEGNYIAYAYDAQGNRIERSKHDPSNLRTYLKQWDYDHPTLPGKLWKEINADMTFTEYSYDSTGKIQSVTDPENNITSYTYDALNRLRTVTQQIEDPANPGTFIDVVTTYDYDSHGNLEKVTDAEGHETTYEYDDMGRVVSTTSPDTGTVIYSYDETGNLLDKTDAKDITVTYSYDYLNRLLGVDFPTDTDISYTYDVGTNGKGNLTGMVDASGSTAFVFDNRGRLYEKQMTIEGDIYTVTRGYTSGNRVSSMTYPVSTSGRRTVNYDRTGGCACNINNVSTTYNSVTTILADNFDYRPFGGPKGMATGSGQTVNNGIDESGRITASNPEVNAGMEHAYGYDDNGNLTSVQRVQNSWYNETYTYDKINRLSTAVCPSGTFGYAYDKVGNRLTRTMNVTADVEESETYTYFTGTNKLESVVSDNDGVADVFYTYDDNGNPTQMGNKIFTYNQNNRIINIDSMSDATYTYNGLGQRVKKEVDGVVTLFHYDFDGNLIAESMDDGTIIAEYLYLGSSPLVKVDVSTNSISYYINNHLGTPIMMTDDSGYLVWEAVYDPFGEADVSGNSTVVNNLRFPGQYFDQETGLHYNYQRYYHPRIGRYLTPDPIGLSGGINLYTYTVNNPINAIDPEGLASCTFVGSRYVAGARNGYKGTVTCTFVNKNKDPRCCETLTARAVTGYGTETSQLKEKGPIQSETWKMHNVGYLKDRPGVAWLIPEGFKVPKERTEGPHIKEDIGNFLFLPAQYSHGCISLTGGDRDDIMYCLKNDNNSYKPGFAGTIHVSYPTQKTRP